jgi:hypothetical protein
MADVNVDSKVSLTSPVVYLDLERKTVTQLGHHTMKFDHEKCYVLVPLAGGKFRWELVAD